MKILHVLDHSIPLHSGYTFRTLAILRQQRAFGWDTVQVTSSKQGASERSYEDVDGFSFYRTLPKTGWAWGLPLVNQWAVVKGLEGRLAGIIAKERPDIVHAHSPSLNGIAAIRAARPLRVPVVYECRAFWEDAAADHGTSREGGARYRLTRAAETWVFRSADAVTCICEGLRDEIVGRQIGHARVTVIGNGVDTARFSYGAPRDPELVRQLGLEGAAVLGFLGSFYAYEGIDLAIRAMPGILQKVPKARLLLVGGGPQESLLRDLSLSLGLDREVVFVGRVPHDVVERYYGLVDLLVFPRYPMRLTELVTPLKPLEAMAQGKLVLASDVGGHRELIRHGTNGWLFPAGDAGAFCQAAVSILTDSASCQPQKEAARRYAEEERSWLRSVSNYRSAYQSATEAARSRVKRMGPW
jgi:PEP-CTERM/exosortase A-associated glycosyltransferase